MGFVPSGDGIAAALLTLESLEGGDLADRARDGEAPAAARQRAPRRPRRARRPPSRRPPATSTREHEALSRPRPRARAPERHRAAGARDGRGADGRRRPTRSAAASSPRSRRRGACLDLQTARLRGSSRPSWTAGRADGQRIARPSRRPPRPPTEAAMCGIVGYVGASPGAGRSLLAGLEQARVPRLRLGRHLRSQGDGRLDAVRAVGNLSQPARGGRRQPARDGEAASRRVARRRATTGHRPHPLGDARPRHRGERPPALRHRGPRPRRRQRHRRELPRAQAGARRRRAPSSPRRPTPRSSPT